MMNVSAYYRAALAGLRHQESNRPSGRRVGPDADALWKSFEGSLGLPDRLLLMLEDANAQWPRAFGARHLFRELDDAHEDAAFGPSWPPLTHAEARALLGDLATAGPVTLEQALREAAAAWSVELADVEAPALSASSRVVVSGPSAVFALALASAPAGFEWSGRVALVADAPGARQLGLLAAAMLDVRAPLTLFRTGDEPTGDWSGSVSFVGPDATEAEAELSHRLVRG